MTPNTNFKGKNVFISGASRGIGLGIALAIARDGANVAIAAKTVTPHPKLPGTIFTAADEISKAGGRGLPIECDIRNEESVQKAVDKTVQEFGGIDIVINNASAISVTNTQETSLKKYDLINTVNARGTWLVSKTCIPHLLKSAEQSRNPHILTLSPPLDHTITDVKWWKDSTAYSLGKFGMSLITLGLSGELEGAGVGVNALWPLTSIQTAALQVLKDIHNSRDVSIMAEAAYEMLKKDGQTYTGQFEIDELFLRREKDITDFSKYVFQADPRNPKYIADEDLDLDFFIADAVLDELKKQRAARSKL
jgi:citronellol/citronellal dehydrogenase